MCNEKNCYLKLTFKINQCPFDLCLESNPEQLKVFEEVKCWYLAKLLDVGLNAVPVSEH